MIAIDEEGIILPNGAVALQTAIINARQIAAAEVTEGHLGLDHRIEVIDAGGGVVGTVHFRDVVKVKG